MNKKKTDKSERCRAFRIVGLVSYPPVSTEGKKHEVLWSKIPSLPITGSELYANASLYIYTSIQV